MLLCSLGDISNNGIFEAHELFDSIDYNGNKLYTHAVIYRGIKINVEIKLLVDAVKNNKIILRNAKLNEDGTFTEVEVDPKYRIAQICYDEISQIEKVTGTSDKVLKFKHTDNLDQTVIDEKESSITMYFGKDTENPKLFLVVIKPYDVIIYSELPLVLTDSAVNVADFDKFLEVDPITDIYNRNYTIGTFSNSKFKVIDLDGLDTRFTTDLSRCFLHYKGEIKNIDKLDTSRVVTMSEMFSFTHNPNIKGLNTDSCMNMSSMFNNCNVYGTDLDFSSFNTSKVVNMNSMFQHCTAKVLDLYTFDTSNVCTMHGMFYKCAPELFNIKSFNTVNVRDMSGTFSNFDARKLGCFDLSNFNTINVVDMHSMFAGARLIRLIIPFNTKSLETMLQMFMDCIVECIDCDTFDTTTVRSMKKAFYNCKAKVIKISKFNQKSLRNIDKMFMDCEAEEIELPTFDESIIEFKESVFEGLKTPLLLGMLL